MKKLLLASLVLIAALVNAQEKQQKQNPLSTDKAILEQLLDRPVITTFQGQDVFLQKDLSDYLNLTAPSGTASDNDTLKAYFMRPNPSVATIKRYFQDAADEFGVPAALLEVIGQVENNWTQTGPTIDKGWGIMHLVRNNYCNTLSEAAVLIGVSEQTLKDDARQNIRGAAALISSYAGNKKKNFQKIEDWLPAIAKFSGLINQDLRDLQARTYLETLKNGVQAPTVWGETIIIPPYSSITLPPDNYKNKNQLKGGPKSSDYSPALTNMAPTCNYASGRTHSIDTWVMHWVGTGTYAGAISWFLNCSSSVSAHFVIRSSDGQITQCVAIANTAWHCGATGYPYNNPRSIGVEHEATSANPGLWNSTSMLQASATMACYFKNQYNFPTTQNTCPGIAGHNSMPGTSTACPGSLPWSTWYGYFNTACAPAGTCVTCPSYDFSITPSTSWQTSSSSIGASGCKIYRVSVTSGRDYTFQTGCGNGGTASFDTYLTLYNSSCSTLATDDDGCSSPSNTSTITWTATYTGYAYLKVSGYGTNSGTFTLAHSYVAPVTCVTCPSYDFSITPSTSWQTSSSSIVSGGCKIYRVSVTSGNDYTFQTGCGNGGTADFDTYLTLYDASCSSLATDDDGCSSPSNTSTITWSATFTGYAYIKVSGFSTNSGNFTLAYSYVLPVICNTCPTYDYSISPSTSWQTHGSSIVASGCKMYQVAVTSGRDYTFKTGCGDGATASFDTYLTLFDGSCSSLATDDDGCSTPSNTSTITWTSTYSGYAYVKVSGFSTNYGSYTLAYNYTICAPSTDPSSANASPATICSGSSTVLSVSGGSLGTGATWEWYAGGCGGTSAGSGSSITVSPTAPTNYYVRAEGSCGTSNCVYVSVTVNPALTTSVSISANPSSPVCSGTNITFTPNPVNGGNPSYQWFVNGNYTSNSTNFSTSGLQVGAQVYCVMTSTANCATPVNATSNTLYPSINQSVTPSVSISASPSSIVCYGTNVTFTPNPVNGGSPTYMWYVNGNYVSNATSFSSSTLPHGAQVYCIMTSTANCAVPVNATSNTVIMTVNPVLTPAVSITASPQSPVCSGTDVTFTPNPVNGGTPSYQWFVNGSLSGTGTSFSSTSLTNGAQIYCVMTSTAGCANPVNATSNTVSMTINPILSASVSITSNPASPVCSGANVTFTPAPVNGGTPSYQWFVNGNAAGTGTTYSSSTLPDGAQIYCTMTSTATCASPLNSTSNTVIMTVNTSVTTSVSILANPPSPVCSGTNVTFTPTPVNGGTPSYQWFVNGSPAGNGATYSSTSLPNGAQVICVMTSNAVCASPVNATSNTETMIVNTTVTPAVSIVANPPSPVCIGTNVTFTPTPVGGGTPSYQWYLNSSPVSSGTTYTTAALNSGDQIFCVMTSNAVCATATDATSNTILMTVSSTVAPTVSISANPAPPVCIGTNVTYTPTPVNGGTPTYQWYLNGNAITTGNTFSSAGLANGDQIFCVMTSNSSCANPVTATSNTETLQINPLPAIPTITQIADTLVSSAQTGNQWLDSGHNAISGETGITFVPLQSGTYYVMVTDMNGCSNTSLPYNFLYVGISAGNTTVRGISIYPNPVSGERDLMISGIVEETAISIFNIDGQLLNYEKLRSDGTIRIPHLPASVYIIKFETAAGFSYKMLMVQ